MRARSIDRASIPVLVALLVASLVLACVVVVLAASVLSPAPSLVPGQEGPALAPFRWTPLARGLA